MAHVRFDACRVAFDTRAAGCEVDKTTLRTCELLVADSGLSSVHTAVCCYRAYEYITKSDSLLS